MKTLHHHFAVANAILDVYHTTCSVVVDLLSAPHLASGLADRSIDEYLKEALTHVVTILILVAILILVPGISLFLPNLLM